MTVTTFVPAGPFKGTITPPADKSISHRAAILAAMGTEPVRIANYLDAHDTNSTLAAVQALGAKVERLEEALLITGVGLHGARDAGIDVGNAGTLMRLLPGWLAGVEGRRFSFDGDDSIRRRPVDRIADPLRAMGARIDATDGRLPPFTVTGTKLQGIEYALPVASAQVKSCMLLAGLLAGGKTTAHEPVASRDHTERMLAAGGAAVTRDGLSVTVTGERELRLPGGRIPGDPSSAAFAIAAAGLVKGSEITIEGSGLNWTRTGFHRIARRMGVVVEGELEPILDAQRIPDREPIGPLVVRSGELVGTTVTANEVPLAIDELPLVALLGVFAEGETVVQGAEELRVKESDRIETVVTGLRGLGAEIEGTDDGFVVTGTGSLRGGTIDSHGDHRLAMLGALAGFASKDGVDVENFEAAAVSYPGFCAAFRAVAS